ncbi:F0F1 ATP synthase subunit delta [Schaalia suimastitidis]|uniref:F0F1 ATP synthase subunit delta n=1 Tax=Schaalia suimastitidis TaxID=121163 RepID=UPI0003F73FFB|nr:F0F1 ATP synthase subunit delta [Schaalia suimastitidis]
MITAPESISDDMRHAIGDILAPSACDRMRVAEDIFGISDILHSDARLRRALCDPARAAADKEELLRHAFAASIQPASLKIVNLVAHRHWSSPEHIPVVVEACGVYVVLVAAQHANVLPELENELLQLQEVLADNRDLRVELSDMGHGTAHERGQLAQKIFGKYLTPYSNRLLRRAVGRTAHGRLLSKLRHYAERAAAMEERALVSVQSAVPLSQEQVTRLRRLMSARLGREVSLAITIDPKVIGGFRLLTGTEAVDATIAARLAELRRSLVG